MTYEPGQTLSHFRLIEKIGEGGMGVVYRAEDEKLQRTVALKVLPPDKLGDEEHRLRFLREARAAAAVTHPNIAVVHAIDEAEGVVFIAMELIEGKTLREAIGGRPLPLREALRLGVEIAEGLSAAHQARVIHRDLKPDNVIVTPGGHVKILDFGLAKLLEERVIADPAEPSKLATVSDAMTQAGRVLGTAAYMSPEQARGLAVDARSDLFSFGIVLYEMVTGRTPFRGTTSMDTMSAILREQPVPAVQLNPEVPAAMERILGKCLEKEPGERYQHAQDLVVDLRRVKRDSESQPLRKAEPAPSRTGFKRIVWPAAVVSVLGAAVAGWMLLGPRHSGAVAPSSPVAPNSQAATAILQPEVASIAVLPFANMSGDADNEYFADGLAEELLNALAKVSGLRVIARTSAFQFKGKNEDVRIIGEKLNVGAVLEGSVRKSKGRVRITVQLLNTSDGFHLWSETYERTLDDIFAVEDEIARAVTEAMKVVLVPGAALASRGGTKNVEAYSAYLRARSLSFRAGAEDLSNAVRELESAVALDPRYALAWASLAGVRFGQGANGYVPLDEARRKTKEALDRALSIDRDLPEARLLLATLRLSDDWDFAAWNEETRRALTLAPGHAEIVAAAGGTAIIFGRLDEAYALASRAIQLDPLNHGLRSGRAWAAFHLGRWDEAESELRELVRLEPTLPFRHGMLGMFLLARGRFAEARAEAEMEPLPYMRLTLVATASHALGREVESDTALGELVDKFGDVAAYQIAEVHAFRGDADRAFDWLERAKRQRDVGLFGFPVDPLLEKIREDARYKDLLTTMHLTKSSAPTASVRRS